MQNMNIQKVIERFVFFIQKIDVYLCEVTEF